MQTGKLYKKDNKQLHLQKSKRDKQLIFDKLISKEKMWTGVDI